MSAPAAGPADAIRGRLTALAADQPALAGAAGLYRAILPLLSAAVPHAARPAVTPAAAARAAGILAAGRPLLPALLAANDPAAAVGFDLVTAEALARQIAEALAEQGVAGAAELAAALAAGEAVLPWARRPATSPDAASPDATSPHTTSPGLNPRAERAKVSDLSSMPKASPPVYGRGRSRRPRFEAAAALSHLVASYALRPQWQAWREAWEPPLAGAIAAWGRGQCYLCGAAPVLAELRGHDGARYLRCGRCGAAWPYPRLACAGCGSQEPADLGVLIPESDPDRLRIDTCDRCHTYLKAIATFEPLAAELLAVEDLATLFLDEVARKQGYRRPEPADPIETPARINFAAPLV